MPYGLTATGLAVPTVNDILTSIQTDELAQIDAGLDLASDQVIGQLNGIYASKLSELWELATAVYTGLDPDKATGQQLTAACALSGTTRKAATAGLVTTTCNFAASQTYTAGQLRANVSGQATNTWVNRDAITTGAGGNLSVVFVCEQTGPIAANAGTLTVITTPVSGWTSITNANDATKGTAQETDAALRLRRVAEQASAGSSNIDSTRTALTKVTGVQQAIVLENTGLITDANGIPGKSIRPIVWDGATPAASNSDLAAAIWTNKPSGIYVDGVTSATVYDATGTAQTVRFTRASQTLIYVTLTVKTDPATFVGTAATIQAAVAALGASQKIGGTVYALAIESAVLAIPGVVDVTAFAIGTAASPTLPNNISIGSTSIALFDTSRVTVTIT